VRPYFFAINMLLIFSSVDCRKNPIIPNPTNGTDTTNHAFTFQTFTFGGGGGSELTDVAIINDTLAYAVGEIYLPDSTVGQPYSVAIWDGQNWRLRKLFYNTNMLITSIRGIQIINSNDIWLAAGSVFHWDGVSSSAQLMYSRLNLPDPSATIEKIWGSSSSSLYGVGNAGTIVHYDGSSWTKLNSGTTLPINDIWGAQNPQTGQWEILAVASDDVNKKLLSIQGTTVSSVSDSGLSNSLYGVWFVPNIKYYVVGAGIGQKNTLNNSPWSVYPSGVVTSYLSGGVRGNDTSDVFVAGSFFAIVHYNGSTWHNYKDVIPFTDGGVGRIAVKGNLMVTVGLSGQNAVVIIGKRN
jgi:hypothetical protein